MNVLPVLDAMLSHGCPFVVTGSAARWLLDGVGCPADLDVVVADDETSRRAVAVALAGVGGWIHTAGGRRRIDTLRSLPRWSWRVITGDGPVDVMFQFVDGTGYTEHRSDAVEARLDDGRHVWCHRSPVAA